MKTLNFRWGRGVLVKALNNLGCVWIGWKPISEINFRKIHAFGCHGKHYFPENDFRLTTNFTFDPEMNFSPHFHFNSLPEKERERERESARAREGKIQFEIASSSSSPMAWSTARSRSRRRSRSGAIAISDRDRSVIAIAIQIAIASRRSRSRSCVVIVDDFFSWVVALCFLICVFLLLFQTPENIFRKIFWNATKHMETFSFSEK